MKAIDDALKLKAGFSPLREPFGRNCIEHHTDVPMTEDDEITGNVLSYNLGDLFSDKWEESPKWDGQMCPQEVWTRVARALRVHGLKIVNR